jgi:hypothetical protein
MWPRLRHVLATEGLLSLWRGNMINCVQSVPHSAVKFSAYDAAKKHLLRRRTEGGNGLRLTNTDRMFAGSFAGFVSHTLTMPLEVLKTSLNATTKREGGFLSIAKTRYAEGGITAMYRGLTAQLLSSGVHSGAELALYDGLKTAAHGKLLPRGRFASSVQDLLLAMLSSAGSLFMSYPLRLSKTRLIMARPGERNNSFTILRRSFEARGLRGLYQGLGPSLLLSLTSRPMALLLNDLLLQTFFPAHHKPYGAASPPPAPKPARHSG